MLALFTVLAVLVLTGVVAVVKDGGVRPASYRRDWSVGAMLDRTGRG